jgi:dimethylargininase
VRAIASLGFPVDVVPSADDCPDACFIEDTCVILGKTAVITQPGALSRRGETPTVAEIVGRHCSLATMDGEATLDGGDVLRVGARLFVGMSARTNGAGVAFLGRVAAREGLEVIAVPVREGLHLKSSCTLVGASTLLVDPGVFGPETLEPLVKAGLELVEVPEKIGANVLSLGSHVVVSADAPRTAAMLRGRGHTVIDVVVSELHKGDGGLTCLSLLLPQPGTFAS